MPVTQSCPYLRIQYKYIGYIRPHPLYFPQFLQCQHKIGQISCPVEGGARILEVRNLEVRLYIHTVNFTVMLFTLCLLGPSYQYVASVHVRRAISETHRQSSYLLLSAGVHLEYT